MSVMKNITRFTAAALAICSVLAVTGCDEQQEMSSSAPTSSNTGAGDYLGYHGNHEQG